MTSLILSGPEHRALWKHLDIIRKAMTDVREVAEHHRVIGLGDLNRRLNADQDAGIASAEAIAAILQGAADFNATMGEGR